MTGRDASPGTLSAIGQRVVCPFQSECVCSQYMYNIRREFKSRLYCLSVLTFETEYVPELLHRIYSHTRTRVSVLHARTADVPHALNPTNTLSSLLILVPPPHPLKH